MTSEWIEVPASQFCSSVRDGTHATPKPVRQGKPLVTSKHIVGRWLNLSSAYQISQKDFDEINKRSKVDQWDVLISMIGTVGEPCLIKDFPEFAIKNIGIFKSKGELEGKWLYYYLCSPNTQQLIRERSRGTTQAYVPLGTLRDFPILVPTDREEMRAITHILGTLDDKIELNRRMNQTLEAMARALFKSWFVDFDGVPAEDMQESELGLIPKGWRIGKLNEVCPIRWGNTSITKKSYIPMGFPAFSAAGQDGYLSFAEHRGIGSVISAIGTVGVIHLAWDEWTAIKNTLVAKCNSDIESSYIHFLLKEIRFPHRGSTQQFISQTDARNLQIAIPPKELRDKFGEASKQLINKIAGNSKIQQSITQLRDALLSKLISGELRVGDVERITGAAA